MVSSETGAPESGLNMEVDPFSLLGVPHHADIPQVRRAFRRLALRYHPDRNPGDPQAATRFKEIAQAYRQVLSSCAHRQRMETARAEELWWEWSREHGIVRFRKDRSNDSLTRIRASTATFIAHHGRALPLVASFLLAFALTALGLLSESAEAESSVSYASMLIAP